MGPLIQLTWWGAFQCIIKKLSEQPALTGVKIRYGVLRVQRCNQTKEPLLKLVYKQRFPYGEKR